MWKCTKLKKEKFSHALAWRAPLALGDLSSAIICHHIILFVCHFNITCSTLLTVQHCFHWFRQSWLLLRKWKFVIRNTADKRVKMFRFLWKTLHDAQTIIRLIESETKPSIRRANVCKCTNRDSNSMNSFKLALMAVQWNSRCKQCIRFFKQNSHSTSRWVGIVKTK